MLNISYLIWYMIYSIFVYYTCFLISYLIYIYYIIDHFFYIIYHFSILYIILYIIYYILNIICVWIIVAPPQRRFCLLLTGLPSHTTIVSVHVSTARRCRSSSNSRLTKLVNIIKSKARPCSQPVRLQGKSGGFTDPKYKGLSNKYIQIWG
jgi:hypothetical protein